ncbi:MAG: three-Cys-motif partner protein TcmP [Gordonia sp. (in: high G+C Gram-positive bacteria)]
MATGANEKYWENSRLPGVLKLTLISKYLPVFLFRTGSVGKEVAYVDGFAGRGVYDNGDFGSPGIVLELAAGQAAADTATRISLYLCEKDQKSHAELAILVDQYKQRNIDVEVECGDARAHLLATLPKVSKVPAFIFEDPTGIGVPFDDLVAAMNRSGDKPWPPTELLLNLSLEAIRRIGGLAASENPNAKTLARLDEALGGDWWQQHFKQGVSQRAVHDAVEEFTQRLAEATGAKVVYAPVRRASHHQPIYHLVFATRHPGGIWQFAHNAALATEAWWQAADEIELERRDNSDGDQLSLIELPRETGRPTLANIESEAIPVIAENIARLVEKHGQITLGEYPVEVFGDYFGRVRESTARSAVKQLHQQRRTPSDGKGGKPEKLVVRCAEY